MIKLFLNVAHAQASIPLPSGFASATASQAAQTLSDFSSYLYLILGVILATVIIEIIIGALRK
jgi:hypothetical protein